jgi:hypothetical protein
VLIFVCGGWLVFYANTITRNAITVTSPALATYALIGAIVFAVFLTLVVKHNHSVYPKRFSEWDRSFICQRCGKITWPEAD